MTNITYKAADVKWDVRSGFGNHRFIVYAPRGKYVSAKLPWRRRDLQPELTGVRITCGERKDGIGSVEITDVCITSCSRDEGEIVFRAPAAGEYEIYYMPFLMPGDWYAPNIAYFSPSDMAADPLWLEGITECTPPKAEVLAYESRTEHDSFYPMEMPMTASERDSFFVPDAPFTAVLESRLLPVRMKHEIPFLWADRASRTVLWDTAYSNEHYAFQIVLCARDALRGVKVRFTDENGREYPLSETDGKCTSREMPRRVRLSPFGAVSGASALREMRSPYRQRLAQTAPTTRIP